MWADLRKKKHGGDVKTNISIVRVYTGITYDITSRNNTRTYRYQAEVYWFGASSTIVLL